jgi:hypothetical protein
VRPLQAQLPLGAGDLIAATHKSGTKKSGKQFDDHLWIAAYGNFKEGFPVSVPEALKHVEAFKQMEAEDCYWTVNGFMTVGRPSRALESVSKLDCLFTDLDYYGTKYEKLSPLELVEQITTDLPWLPTPSVVMDSGRGCWLLWLFQRPLVINKRTKKSADWMPQWYSCQQFLNELLLPYGADPRAVDACRYVRLPETINSKSNSVACSWTYSTHKGKRVDYQFTELKKLFTDRVPKKQKRKAVKSGKVTGNINGVETILNGYSLAFNRINDLELLVQRRGGFLTDMRKRFLDCYLTEAAHFFPNSDTLMATVDNFIDRYFDDPDTYKQYYRKHYSRKIHRAEYVRTQLSRKSREQAFQKDANGKWDQVNNRYIHTNKRLIRLLEITPEEMRKVSRRPYLVTIISKQEKALRRRERAGAMPRIEYTKRASERSQEAHRLRSEGLTQTEIAKRIGVSQMQVSRYLAQL